MVKQVIVIRRDLKMRRGKEIAQGSHASMAWLSDRVRSVIFNPGMEMSLSPAEREWLCGPFTKVVVRVDSEEELLAVKQKADEAGVLNVLITDAGKTEFGGVPTVTCLAVGPAEANEIDAITGGLELY